MRIANKYYLIKATGNDDHILNFNYCRQYTRQIF